MLNEFFELYYDFAVEFEKLSSPEEYIVFTSEETVIVDLVVLLFSFIEVKKINPNSRLI